MSQNVMMHYNNDMHGLTNYLDQHDCIQRLLEMDKCHDILIYGPIQISISTQIVRVAPQCC